MRNTPDSIMLFAAGFGTRMGALTEDTPKPLIQAAGKPLIQHALDICSDGGVPNVVVNTHYFAEKMQEYLEPRSIAISHEDGEILETGGGLKAALPLLGSEPTLTMNTDSVWHGKNPINEIVDQWDPEVMDALLLLIAPERLHGHTGGDFRINQDLQIRRGGPFVYSGLQIIKTEILKEIEDVSFSISRLWDRFAHKQTLFGTVYSGDWCDVGHPEGIEIAERLVGYNV